MKNFIIAVVSACLLHAAFGAPQLISFKDGKVGVNFFGYHAEAGLGGQNSGNGLLGGLHASAGTPWGQNAAAGLGGNVNGRASGLLYAGAQAMPDVGAGVVLGGDTSQGGYAASEAYVPGKVSHSSRTVQVAQTASQATAESDAPVPVTDGPNVIQKVKSKRYRGDAAQKPVVRQRLHHHQLHQQRKLQRQQDRQRSKTVVHTVEKINVAAVQNSENPAEQGRITEKHISAHKHKLIATGSVEATATHPPPAPVKVAEPVTNTAEGYVNIHKNSNVVPAALQIPIGILQSLQQSLSGLGGSIGASGGASVTKYH
ncbi:uncharacterized protein isoform X2 [Musca autumnalis]|uniref:uncharacterized protein isoform X2 n=1 Tax=Musca autumnalis TaxID=221902 RepID=UPI003CF61B5D